MNNLYEQYGRPVQPQLPAGLTMQDIRYPQQTLIKMFGNIMDPKQFAINLVASGRFSQGQLNDAIKMANQFRNGQR